MKHITIIATSLNEDSKSQNLAKLFESHLIDEKISCERFDIRTMNIPFCGSSESWGSKDVMIIKESVERSSHIVFAVPVYNYYVNSAAKNIVELISRAFTKKVIGFICSAGGSSSYMSVMSFANHLMLDFRSIIVPRFLYVDPGGWNDDKTLKSEINDRMRLLISDLGEIQVIES